MHSDLSESLKLNRVECGCSWAGVRGGAGDWGTGGLVHSALVTRHIHKPPLPRSCADRGFISISVHALNCNKNVKFEAPT